MTNTDKPALNLEAINKARELLEQNCSTEPDTTSYAFKAYNDYIIAKNNNHSVDLRTTFERVFNVALTKVGE